MAYAWKHQTSEEQIAIDACSCPRTLGDTLAAPLCAVELDTGERESPIFVSMPMQLDCPMGRRFSYGEFCLDRKRISLYRKYGI